MNRSGDKKAPSHPHIWINASILGKHSSPGTHLFFLLNVHMAVCAVHTDVCAVHTDVCAVHTAVCAVHMAVCAAVLQYGGGGGGITTGPCNVVECTYNLVQSLVDICILTPLHET